MKVIETVSLSGRRAEERIPINRKLIPLYILALSHFRTENRIPLFLKML